MQTTRASKEAWLSEPGEIDVELKLLFDDDEEFTIADIGACDGLSSIHYGRMFPMAKIVCFEPRRDNYDEILQNAVEFGLGRITAYRMALADYQGKSTFYVSSGQADGIGGWDTGNKSSSLLEPADHLKMHPWCKFDTTEEVEVDTLDHVVGNLNTPPIRYIHLDVQGAELMVLKGAEKTLKNVVAVWCEVSNVRLYKDQALRSEICRFMSMRGFVVGKDTSRDRGNTFGDCLFVKREAIQWLVR